MNAPWWRRLADGSTRVDDDEAEDDLLPPFYD